METFGDRFRDARAALNMTQDELAVLLEVTKSAISAWENNRETPAFDKLPRIRRHLGVSLDTLICDERKAAWESGIRIGQQPEPAYLAATNPGVAADRDEVRLLRRYRKLDARRRKSLLVLLGDGTK